MEVGCMLTCYRLYKIGRSKVIRRCSVNQQCRTGQPTRKTGRDGAGRQERAIPSPQGIGTMILSLLQRGTNFVVRISRSEDCCLSHGFLLIPAKVQKEYFDFP
jgi:hypothetical protein